jgi:hypothetical protein
MPPQGDKDAHEGHERRQARQRQKQGHFGGLLPAIHSAEMIASRVTGHTLESRPELQGQIVRHRPVVWCWNAGLV